MYVFSTRISRPAAGDVAESSNAALDTANRRSHFSPQQSGVMSTGGQSTGGKKRKKSSMTPTRRTLNLLEKMGYKTGIVERWIPNPAYPGGGKRLDLWNVIDIIAINARDTVAVQSTGTDFAGHVRKIEDDHSQSVLDWIAGPQRRFLLIGWRPLADYKKDGTRKVRDRWTPRIVEYKRTDPTRIHQVSFGGIAE